MDCSCPNPTSLTSITASDCPVKLSEIQKVAVQRVGTPFDTGAGSPTDILELADWQTLIAAADDSKIVITPFFGTSPTVTPGDANTETGLNNVEEVISVNPSTFEAIFRNISSQTEKDLKSLMCEKSLVVYLFLKGGKIAAYEITAGVKYEGFGIQSTFVSDRGTQGFTAGDTVAFNFSLPSGWSDNLVVLEPNFNPLTEL